MYALSSTLNDHAQVDFDEDDSVVYAVTMAAFSDPWIELDSGDVDGLTVPSGKRASPCYEERDHLGWRSIRILAAHSYSAKRLANCRMIYWREY